MATQHYRPGSTAREQRRARAVEAAGQKARIRVHHGGYARCSVSLGRLVAYAEWGV